MGSHNYTYQTGAMMLLTVTLLLMLTTAIGVYSAKVSVVKHTIGLNTQNKINAENMASLGTFQMLTKLSENPLSSTQEQAKTFPEKGQYIANLQATKTDRFDHKLRIIEVNATGKSTDQRATRQTSQHVITYPIIRTLPISPLIVGQSIAIESNLLLVANPNGAGTGLSVSLWTSQDIQLNKVNLTSCDQYEYNQHRCELSSLSSRGNKGIDIIDSPALFPEDIFAYLTNLSGKHRNQLSDEALQLSHCQNIDQLNTALIWVQGDCEIKKETIVGTLDNPVILVIEDGDLTLSENTQVVGIVLLLTPYRSILAANVNSNVNSQIRGALIATESVNFNGQPLIIQFDVTVLKNIQNAPVNWRIAYVPNSWRNF